MAAREGNPARGGENLKRRVEIGLQNSDDNLWRLESSDQPGMVLISIILTGYNYFPWSRFMTIALGAKGKLGFVNGEIEAPDENSPNYRQWKQTDSMVFCWIINSLSEEIIHASLFANTAKDLWDNLAKRYGGINFPLIYEKQVEIAKVRQGSDTVTEYFTKLEKLWSELGNLKRMSKNDVIEQLMQFLMGLNSYYDHARQQILLMDPLPSVYKAYSVMYQVEEKRNTRHEFFAEPVKIAVAVNKGGGKFGDNLNSEKIKVGRKEKAKLQCEHCKDPGHEMSDCFKLHGYPDSYKNRKEQKGKYAVSRKETPLDLNGEVEGDVISKMVADIAKSILSALRKYCGDDGNAFADFAESSGNWSRVVMRMLGLEEK